MRARCGAGFLRWYSRGPRGGQMAGVPRCLPWQPQHGLGACACVCFLCLRRTAGMSGRARASWALRVGGRAGGVGRRRDHCAALSRTAGVCRTQRLSPHSRCVCLHLSTSSHGRGWGPLVATRTEYGPRILVRASRGSAFVVYLMYIRCESLFSPTPSGRVGSVSAIADRAVSKGSGRVYFAFNFI